MTANGAAPPPGEGTTRRCLFPVGTGNSPRNTRISGDVQAYYEPRFRRDVTATLQLPEFAVARLYEELAAGGDLRTTVREYAGLARLGTFMADVAGDHFRFDALDVSRAA